VNNPLNKIAIIGGGAAGFFAALSVKEHHPEAEVSIFEKSQKVLAKVKVSGGGRCNVTNGCSDIEELIKAYPRGGKKLKWAFKEFNTTDTVKWFEDRNVPLTLQDDGCYFPVSQNSQSVIDCLMNECRRNKIEIITGKGVESIMPKENGIELKFKEATDFFQKVIIATGGSPKTSGLDWLKDLDHTIEDCVPSLFTFNMPNEKVKELMGIVKEEVITTIQGTKLKGNGPLLITHWGMSGPAILKLSSLGARVLSERNYDFKLLVNWTNETKLDKVVAEIEEIVKFHPNKLLPNFKPYGIKERLWLHLLDRAGQAHTKRWEELGKKGFNKLIEVLTNDTYEVKGKTTFKEEFVTCGGVSLEDVNMSSMESRKVKNLYFAGEVMDIDAITGGYNFQGAWTTGFIAGQLK
jgi:predicted Rossmann fold flavoprotein|tara:strand:- start:335 stop:1555 length:1221 start_codon:yes stop_codon:yes gene_type:complete